MMTDRLRVALENADPIEIQAFRESLAEVLERDIPTHPGLIRFWQAQLAVLDSSASGGVHADPAPLFLAAASILGDDSTYRFVRESQETSDLGTAFFAELEVARTRVEVAVHEHDRDVHAMVGIEWLD